MADNVPLVGIIMGSQSDWPIVTHTKETLDKLGISNEARVISAHRTPSRLTEFALEAKQKGLKVIIAGAGDDNFIVVDPSGNPPCYGAQPCPDPSGKVVGGMPVTALTLLFNTRNTDPPEFSPTPIQLKL